MDFVIGIVEVEHQVAWLAEFHAVGREAFREVVLVYSVAAPYLDDALVVSLVVGGLHGVGEARYLILFARYREAVDEKTVAEIRHGGLIICYFGYLIKGAVLFQTGISLLEIYVELLAECASFRHLYVHNHSYTCSLWI